MTASTILDEDSAYLDEKPEIHQLNYFTNCKTNSSSFQKRTAFAQKPAMIQKAP